MSTRRRSDRYVVEVPVWLKDGQGGDRTVTADVSAHGIAVLTTKPRPARQYVELELTLPAPLSKINVTAIVARHIEALESYDGRRGVGLGLDFFLLDSRAKQEWQRFIHLLGTEPSFNARPARDPSLPGPSPTPRASSAESPRPALSGSAESGVRRPAPRGDGAPTYIIKPRDLGRLWGFFRSELTKGLVRIETPVALAVGAATELLVVHPTTEAEWTIAGRVSSVSSPTGSGQTVLEIAIEASGAEARTAFRNFVSTGQGMIQEDVAFSADLASIDVPLELTGPISEDLAVSVDLGDEPVGEPETARFDGTRLDDGGSGAIDIRAVLDGEDETSRSVTDVEQPLPIGEEPLFEDAPAPIQVGDSDEPLRPTEQARLEAPPTREVARLEPPPVRREPTAPPLDETPRIAERRGAGAELVSATPFAPERLSGRLFSSFFFEAEASRSEKLEASARPAKRSESSTTKPLDLKSLVPLPFNPNLAEAVALLYAPTSDLGIDDEDPAIFDVPRGVASPGVASSGGTSPGVASFGGTSPGVASFGGKSPGGTAAAVDEPDAGSDFPDPDATQSAMPPPPTPPNPTLVRDLSVARARLMRSPNSVTACYRLGMLLMRSEAGPLEEALQTLVRVTQLEPNHPGAHHALADVLCRRGEVESAAEHLHRAKRLGYQINPDLERQIADARAQAQESRK